MPRFSIHSLDGFTIRVDAAPKAYTDVEQDMTIEFHSDVTHGDGVPDEIVKVTLSGAIREHVGRLLAADLTYEPIRELADQLAQTEELQDQVVSAAQVSKALQADEEAGTPPDSAPDDEVRNSTPRCRKCGARAGEICRELDDVPVDHVSPTRVERIASQGCVVAIAYLEAKS